MITRFEENIMERMTLALERIAESCHNSALTDKQKECEYCHFDDVRGPDFGDECKFQLARLTHGYYLNAWSGLGGSDFDVASDYIHYCPMCGRKLGEED